MSGVPIALVVISTAAWVGALATSGKALALFLGVRGDPRVAKRFYFWRRVTAAAFVAAFAITICAGWTMLHISS